MLKVRVMGSKNDIVWFERTISRAPRLEIESSSEILSNKGTDRYHRKYIDIKRTNVKQQNKKEKNHV